MTDILVQIIFGWPAIIASLLFSALGLVIKRPWLLAASAVLITPFSLYLSGMPAVRTPAIGLPFLQAGAAYAVHKGKFSMGLILASPLFIVAAWLALIVLTQ